MTADAAQPDFLGDDYLLGNELARTLYHDVAEHLPIVDVHNHLPADDIADDRRWETLTDLWLGDDHYKWRAMRAAGFPEHVVSGDADPWDRFSAWAATVPRLIGNPLYVWTHLELRRVFGIECALGPDTAQEVWDRANEQLASTSARQLLAKFGVDLVATTDAPADPLAAHNRHRAGRATPAMIPTFRPDGAHALLEHPGEWNEWADRLAVAVGGREISDLASLLDALEVSYNRFAALGCRASDHGLARLPDRPRDPAVADAVIRRASVGGAANQAERDVVMLEVVALAARLATRDDAVLQLHLGPLRNASPRLLDLVGRDVGADVIGDERQVPGLVRFLAELEREETLPRTVLYNLNPADNAAFAALAGAFTRPGVAGLVQWGPPWWFNDHEPGMRRHLDELGQIGQLAGFIGMLTDSRSILSMTRHELFRRVLCAKLGDEVADGRFPHDVALLQAMVRRLCHDNTCDFFGLDNQPGDDPVVR